jgi:hypothetical protein
MVQGEQAIQEFSIDLRHRPAVTVVGIFVRRISKLSWSVIPPPRSTSSTTFSEVMKYSFRGRGVFRSASRNWHCHPFLNWKYMYTRR